MASRMDAGDNSFKYGKQVSWHRTEHSRFILVYRIHPNGGGMPFQHSLYRIDQGLQRLSLVPLEKEEILENHIAQDVGILNDRWMIIGRQVHTDYGKYIDLLAVDATGTLIIIELKKDQTPREVAAQTLDYATWVETLPPEQIAEIWRIYLQNHRKDLGMISLDLAFQQRFGIPLSEVPLNEEHQMVVVAARLDGQTERILGYLSDRGIPINVVFFEVFADGPARFLSRVWFKDPVDAPDPVANPARERGPWNGEYYASMGEGASRTWEDGRRYGFISGGGGRWYSRSLAYLQKGNRVWVNVPGTGFVGVGIVVEPMVRSDAFKIPLSDGRFVGLDDPGLELRAKGMLSNSTDDDLAEYLVRINWIHTVPLSQAVKETGFFGNQNTVCQPTDPKWNHTVSRLRQVWGVDGLQ